MANTDLLDKEVTRLTDEALLNGADVQDINNVRSRHGYSTLQEVESVEGPAIEDVIDEEEQPFYLRAVADPTGNISALLPSIANMNSQAEAMKRILPMKQLLNPENPIDVAYRETVAELSVTTPDELARQLTDELSAREQTKKLQLLYDTAGTVAPEDLSQYLSDVMEARDFAKELNPTLQSLDQIVEGFADESIDDYVKRNKRSEMYAWSMYAQRAEEVGILDTIHNWVSEVLVPDSLWDLDDLVGKGMFGSMGEFKNFVGAFQTLDPYEKEIVVEELMPKLWEAYDDNHVAVATVLGYLYSPFYSTGVNVDAVFDALAVADAIGLARIGVSGGKALLSGKKISAEGVKAASNTSRHMADLGNPDIAAGQTIIDTASGVADEVTAAKGVNRTQAMDSVSPINDYLDATSAGRIPEISPEVIRIVERSSIVDEIPELLGDASGKLTRGELKALRAEKADAEFRISKLTEQKDAAMRNQKGKRALQRTEVRAINQSIEDLQLRLQNINVKLARNEDAVLANAALTRIEQGLIPEHMLQPTITEVRRTPISQAVRDIIDQKSVATPVKSPKNSTTKQRIEARKNKLSEELFSATQLAKLGAPQETIKAAQETTSAVEKLIEQQVKLDLFKAEDITRAVDNKIEAIRTQYADNGELIREIIPTNIDREGFTARVVMEDGVTEYNYKFTKDDVGNLITENTDFSSTRQLSAMWSPDYILAPWKNGLVEDATFLGQQAAVMRDGLTREAEKIWKPLSGAERREVNELLLASDNEDTVFTYADIMSGNVQLKSGQKAHSAAVADAYFRMGSLMRDTHAIANNTIRRTLELEGFKEVRYLNKDGGAEVFLGKPYDSFQGINIAEGEYVFDANLNRYIRVHAATKAAWADRGAKPVRMLESNYITPNRAENPVEVRWGIVVDEGAEGRVTVNGLPRQVLNTTEGVYIPRVYEKGYHYIRDMSLPRAPVVAVARTAEEAEKAIEAARAASQEPIRWVSWADGQFSEYNRVAREASNYGGLYTSPRKKMPLQVIVDGKAESLERMSASDSIQRYINAQSEMATIAEHRTLQVQRFINTANDLAKKQGLEKGFADPTDWRSPLTLKPGSNEKKLMEQTREYLMATFRLAPAEETTWENFVNAIGRQMEGKGGRLGEKAKQAVLDLRSESPVDRLRAITFYNSMGWFNMRQLFVQAQNAALASSMYPTKAPAAFADSMLMRIAYDAGDAGASTLGKWMGYKGDELAILVNDFRRSGLGASIKRNADLDAVRKGIAGQSLEKMRSFARAGLIFYEEGELFSRLISWNIARRNLFGKTARKLSDEEIKSVSQEAVRMHMNMQAENAAWWQRNAITALPMQFVQVQAKLIENLMPKLLGGTGKWTAREKAFVVGGQFALYGTVGVPIAEDIVNWFAEQTGKTPAQIKEENPNLTAGVTQGMYGVFARALGFNNDFSSAGSIIGGLDDNSLYKMVTAFTTFGLEGYDETKLTEVLLGATGTTVRRAGDAAAQIAQSTKVLFMAPSLETLKGEALESLDSFAAITATWSNARKVWQVDKAGGLSSSRGRVIINREEFDNWNWQTRFARTFGFQTNEEVQYYASKQSKTDRQDFYNQTLDALLNNYRRLQRTGDVNAYTNNMTLILAAYEDDPYNYNRLVAALQKQIFSGKSQNAEQDRQYLREFINSGGQVARPLSEEF